MRWVKLYVEILDDHKMATLPDNLFRVCVNLFALAGRIDDAGRLGTTEEVAYALRLTLETASADLEELKKVRITTEKKGIWSLKNFDKRNERPPSSQREAVKERVKKYRENKPIQEEVKRESNELVTPLHSNGNDPRIDQSRTEEIKEKPISADAPPPQNKNVSRSDPRTKCPEIQLFHKMTGRYPSLINYDEVIITMQGKTEQQLKPFLKEWNARNYNPGSIKWLTDWAASGSIPGNGKPPQIPQVVKPFEMTAEQIANRELLRANNARIKAEQENKNANPV